jgi:hypothetical protein
MTCSFDYQTYYQDEQGFSVVNSPTTVIESGELQNLPVSPIYLRKTNSIFQFLNVFNYKDYTLY